MNLSNLLKYRRVLTVIILALGVGMLLPAGDTGNRALASSCMDIADIPLDAMTQSAPGMIMFVIDDSGSMDWSMMCKPPESDGVFNGNYYIFPDPGDDLYPRDNLEENDDDRMMWMSQWAEYNGLYYDPATEYTPWPRHPDADVDNPLSDPVGRSGVLGYNSAKAGFSLNMTEMWHEWGTDIGVVVDNSDATRFAQSGGWFENGDNNAVNDTYLYANNGASTYWATWAATGLDPSITYDVQASWLNNASERETSVVYHIYDDGSEVPQSPSPGMNQRDSATWIVGGNAPFNTLATGVTFSSGIGGVRLEMASVTRGLCADAVRFVPNENNVSNIYRRHYYVRSTTDSNVYLVNLDHSTTTVEYYRVNLIDPTDNREVVTAGKLIRVASPPADISTDWNGNPLTYANVSQNFANWYSFYRRRELTAKNAIANVIDKLEGVFTGLIYINNYRSQDQRALPVRVKLESGLEDESDVLLANLYGYNYSSYGTPLRNGLKKAGRFYQGDYLDPGGSYISETGGSYYPYFKPDKGGSCQQAFTIVFTDGYYNGSDPYTIDNDDGDDNTDFDGAPFGDGASDTLADVAMYYYERDLNGNLDDDGSVTDVDPAKHQHMVTYTLAFGVTGSLNPADFPDCPTGACPVWPSTSSDSGKIDDLYHAAVNGRGAYLSAGSTAELNQALEDLSNSIKYRLGSAASLATGSVQRTEGSVIYQGKYNSNDWSGELLAWNLNLGSGSVGSGKWPGGATIPAWDTRTILTSDGTSGYLFEVGNLSATQSGLLTASGLGTAEQIVNYLRGDTSNPVLRNRSVLLGDIVHSAPTYFDGTVYIGANDGMLHAFDAATGVEQFAYVPNLVYDHLAELADPDYTHRYYVDNTATVVKVDGRNILVGALGKGGKGYFALDVTDPGSMDATADFLWEFPSGGDDDMGFSFSQANIVKTRAAGQVVVFGNGYDSVNGTAVFYVIDALTGAEIRRFDTKVADCNGLSMPAVVDMQLDGYADFIFAGDLKGNMWKIDIRDESAAKWGFAYGSDAAPAPLITVQNASGEIQPITAAPEVMLDCVSMLEARGLMLLFGTGQYLNKSDFDDRTVQSVYGVWDLGPIWEELADADTAKTKSLGTFLGNRTLSGTTPATLMEQVFVDETDLWWTMTDNIPMWYDPILDSGSHVGWYFDLPESDEGERLIQSPLLRIQSLVLVSTIPSSSPCDAGGRSSMYIVRPCTGGATGRPEFDTNDDKKVDELDVIVTISDPEATPTGKKSTAILYGPLEIDDMLYLVDPDGNIPEEPVVANPAGMYYWRTLGD